METTCSTYGNAHKCVQSLVGKRERQALLGKPGRRWEDDIEVYPDEIMWEGVNLICFTRLRAQGGVLCTR